MNKGETMNKSECAEALYDLIVVKGRRKGNVSEHSLFGNAYDRLPDFFKELWELKAEEFAAENNFKLED